MRLAFILPYLIPLAAASAREFTSPRIEAITSWIGNNYGGRKKWVQQDIHAMAVMPDGTVFTNVGWDEAGGNAGEYRDGALVRYGLHTHGWGNQGGAAVAANSRYVYLGVSVDNEGGGLKDPNTWPPTGAKWLGISRRTRADMARGAPFEGGKGGKGDSLNASFLIVEEVTDNEKGSLAGIAADETRVYVTAPHTGEMKLFDAETMRQIASWKINHAGPLALDSAGVVWMLERRTDTGPPRLVRFNASGQEQAPAFTFPPTVVPTAFCLVGDGRVLVADDSAAQQIRISRVTLLQLA